MTEQLSMHALLRLNQLLKIYFILSFPGDSVVKNQPANAGDTGSVPDLGRSHMLWSIGVLVPQLLSQCSRAWGTTATEALVP